MRFSRGAEAIGPDGKKCFSVRGTVASGHPDSWHPSRSDSRAGARGGRLAAVRVAERTSLGVWLGLIREPSNRKRTASGCSALREQKALKIWREGSASAKPAVSDVFGGGLARTGSRGAEDAIAVGNTPGTHLFELGGQLHLEVDLGVVLRVETDARVRRSGMEF